MIGEDGFIFFELLQGSPISPFPEVWVDDVPASPFCCGDILRSFLGGKTILTCQTRQVTFCGKQQQQQPCGSSKLRSAALKQQQQSTRLAAVPGKPSDLLKEINAPVI